MIYVSWAKFHSVAQAEWGATFQVGTEDLSKKGDRGYHDTRRHRFCSRGGLPRLDNPVWSGALALGGGLALAAWSATPPRPHGVSNRESGGGARGICEQASRSTCESSLVFTASFLHC